MSIKESFKVLLVLSFPLIVSSQSTDLTVETASITSGRPVDPETGIINRNLSATAKLKLYTSVQAQKALEDTLNQIKNSTQCFNAESIHLCFEILENTANIKNISSESFRHFSKIYDILLDLLFEKFHESYSNFSSKLITSTTCSFSSTEPTTITAVETETFSITKAESDSTTSPTEEVSTAAATTFTILRTEAASTAAAETFQTSPREITSTAATETASTSAVETTSAASPTEIASTVSPLETTSAISTITTTSRVPPLETTSVTSPVTSSTSPAGTTTVRTTETDTTKTTTTIHISTSTSTAKAPTTTTEAPTTTSIAPTTTTKASTTTTKALTNTTEAPTTTTEISTKTTTPIGSTSITISTTVSPPTTTLTSRSSASSMTSATTTHVSTSATTIKESATTVKASTNSHTTTPIGSTSTSTSAAASSPARTSTSRSSTLSSTSTFVTLPMTSITTTHMPTSTNSKTTTPIGSTSITTSTAVSPPATTSTSKSSTSPTTSTVGTSPTTTTDPATEIINGNLSATANQTLNTSAEAQNALNEILNQIENNKQHLDGESIYLCSEILKNAANVKNISNEVFYLFLRIVDVLLDLPFEKFHESDVDENSRGKIENSTNRIAKSFENLVLNSANATVSYLTGNNIAIVARPINPNQPTTNGLIDCDSEGFRDYSEDSDCENGNPQVTVIIPGDAIKNSIATKMFFMIFRNRKLFDQRHSVPPENANPCDNKNRLPSPRVATATVVGGPTNSAKVNSGSEVEHAVTVKYDMSAMYKALNQSLPLHGVHLPSYWDWNALNWSVNGCKAVSSDNGIFEGHCNHLTDFTIIFQGTKFDPIVCNSFVTFTGYVLSTTSSFVLFILIGIFIATSVTALHSIPLMRRLSGSQTTNRLLGLPYLVTLFCYYFIFTIFIDQSAINISDVHCNITAVVLYTCLISVVLWTIVQGLEIVKRFYIFTRTERVLDIATNIYLSSVICIGIPIVLTVILWIVTDDFFSRSDGFCWIRPDYVLFGVIFPTSLFVLNDILLTIIIVYQMFFVNRMENDENNRRIQTSSARRRERFKKIAALASMQLILGAPWVLQYFAIGEPKLVLSHILFTVINGAQGFMVGLLYLLTRYKQHRAKRRQQRRSIAVGNVRRQTDANATNNRRGLRRVETATEVISHSSGESFGQSDVSEPSIYSRQSRLTPFSNTNVFYKNPSNSVATLQKIE